MTPKKDTPNFAAWSNQNLANFATEAYIRMQELQEENEHLKLDAKAALEAARKEMLERIK
jgi:hypothetical protein